MTQTYANLAVEDVEINDMLSRKLWVVRSTGDRGNVDGPDRVHLYA